MAGYPENKRGKKPHPIPSLQRFILPSAQVRVSSLCDMFLRDIVPA